MPKDSTNANKEEDKPTAKEQKEAEEKAAGTPMKDDEFALQDLLDNGMVLFGHPGYVIVGALHGKDPKPTYTKAEIKKAIDNYLALEVS